MKNKYIYVIMISITIASLLGLFVSLHFGYKQTNEVEKYKMLYNKSFISESELRQQNQNLLLSEKVNQDNQKKLSDMEDFSLVGDSCGLVNCVFENNAGKRVGVTTVVGFYETEKRDRYFGNEGQVECDVFTITSSPEQMKIGEKITLPTIMPISPVFKPSEELMSRIKLSSVSKPVTMTILWDPNYPYSLGPGECMSNFFILDVQ